MAKKAGKKRAGKKGTAKKKVGGGGSETGDPGGDSTIKSDR